MGHEEDILPQPFHVPPVYRHWVDFYAQLAEEAHKPGGVDGVLGDLAPLKGLPEAAVDGQIPVEPLLGEGDAQAFHGLLQGGVGAGGEVEERIVDVGQENGISHGDLLLFLDIVAQNPLIV